MSKFKFYLFFVYLLNVSDIILTQFLRRGFDGFVAEVNPFLIGIIDTRGIFWLKVIVPLVVLVYWYKRVKSDMGYLSISCKVALIMLVIYSLINVGHCCSLLYLRGMGV